MMRIYTMPGTTRETVTLVADAATWRRLVPHLEAAERGALRPKREPLATLQAALGEGGTPVVRITVAEEDARRILHLAGVGTP